MISWAILGGLFFISGMIYILREIKYISRLHKLKIISFTRLIYSLTYGFFPALLCFLYAFNNQKLQLSSLVIMDYDSEALGNLYLFWLFSVVGYIALNVAYSLFAEKKLRFGSKIGNSDSYDFSEQQVILIAFVALFIGAFSLHMWTKDIGGVFKFIPLASGIRGDYLNTYGNTHTAWRQPAKIILPATFLSYFLAINCDTKNKILSRVLFVITFFVAILYLVCNDGRLTIALFFAILIIGLLTNRSVRIKNPKKLFFRLAIIGVLAGMLLANLDDITYFIRHQTFRAASESLDTGVITKLMEEFLFVYKSGITSIQTTLWEGESLQLINDIVVGITAYLPSRFSPTGFTRVFRYNTALCTGNASSTIGTIPTDMISLSIYDFGWIGPIVVPFIIGGTISLLEGHFRGKRRDAYHWSIYSGLIMSFFRIVNYCEMQDIALSLFPYIVIFFVAHFIQLVTGQRRKRDKSTQRF